MLECAKCGADRSEVASDDPCPKCGEAGRAEANAAAAVESAPASDAGGARRGSAVEGSNDWVDDTSPDSEDRLQPADLEAWRKRTVAPRDPAPVRQPPPGLRPSRRASSGVRVSPVQVPPPPPMDFTPAPELVPVDEATSPPPEPIATPARAAPPVMAAGTPPSSFATPPPASAPAVQPAGESFDIPDMTDEIDPQPAPAVWKQGHPSARRWAEKRQGGPAVAPRRAPSLPRIVLGLLIAALGAWLVLSFLPDRKPLTAGERARVSQQAGIDSDAWRFGQAGYMAARGGAALYLTIGALVALRGLLFRRRIEIGCRRCGRTVLAERSGLSLRCDGGAHAAGVNVSAVALLIAFVALSLGLAALIAMSSLG